MTDLETLKRDMIGYADAMGFDDQPNETCIPGLALVRGRACTEISAVDYQPIFCLVLQGAKQAFLGDRILTFAERQCLIVSLDLPTVSRVVEASPQKPYLALALTLDLGLIRELAATLEADGVPLPQDREGYRCSALHVGQVDDGLTDAMARLFALRGSQEEIRILAPLLVREIHYRLLRSSEAALLRSLARPDSRAERIARAIAWIRRDYAGALPVADLAREAGMSASAFHEHFRALTGTTPLQYQKALRLMEARRLIDGSDSVAGIAFAVGYESPTQFSREYARKFGNPPRADRAVAG